jgi:hypothetical protein
MIKKLIPLDTIIELNNENPPTSFSINLINKEMDKRNSMIKENHTQIIKMIVDNSPLTNDMLSESIYSIWKKELINKRDLEINYLSSPVWYEAKSKKNGTICKFNSRPSNKYYNDIIGPIPETKHEKIRTTIETGKRLKHGPTVLEEIDIIDRTKYSTLIPLGCWEQIDILLMNTLKNINSLKIEIELLERFKSKIKEESKNISSETDSTSTTRDPFKTLSLKLRSDPAKLANIFNNASFSAEFQVTSGRINLLPRIYKYRGAALIYALIELDLVHDRHFEIGELLTIDNEEFPDPSRKLSKLKESPLFKSVKQEYIEKITALLKH